MKSEQAILREFVRTHVHADITDLADAAFGTTSPTAYQWSDFINYEGYFCPHCGEYVGKHEILFEDEETGELRCPLCGASVEESDLDWSEAEIAEYYIVSELLGSALIRHGAPVMPRHLGWVWGRKTSGQAIYMDGVIREICVEYGLIDERKE